MAQREDGITQRVKDLAYLDEMTAFLRRRHGEPWDDVAAGEYWDILFKHGYVKIPYRDFVAARDAREQVLHERFELRERKRKHELLGVSGVVGDDVAEDDDDDDNGTVEDVEG